MAVERYADGMKLASVARQHGGTGAQPRTRRSAAQRLDARA
ncbi:MAG TPA: hypothetical protein VN326_23945 [Casimicrobiaceae bacterium]|nr:hypothetical protein [Casimicrobiaceae bacterium]